MSVVTLIRKCSRAGLGLAFEFSITLIWSDRNAKTWLKFSVILGKIPCVVGN